MRPIFDIERAGRESGLSHESVQQILREVREEFPDEALMYELHVVRALQAEKTARLSSEEWAQSVRKAAHELLDQHGLEHVVTPTDPTPTIQRRSTPRHSAG